jgi:hypothetical protein
MPHIVPLIPRILAAIDTIKTGEAIEVRPR